MPRLLANRLKADSIAQFRSAARIRHGDARCLAESGRGTAAVYLWGYVAEMTLKAGWFQLIGFGKDDSISLADLNSAKQAAQAQGINWSGNLHNLFHWAELLVRHRISLGRGCEFITLGGKPMPLHRRSPTTKTAELGNIMNDLVEELRTPSSKGQPIIVEDSTPETGSIRVHVIWDRWSRCDKTSRSKVILDAYQTARGDEIRRQITLALGLTVAEAIATGLLPYRIVPAHRRSDQPADKDYLAAINKAGAIVIAGDDLPQLRFATQEDAEGTLEDLQGALPVSKWIIIQEVADASTSTSFVTSTSVSLRHDD